MKRSSSDAKIDTDETESNDSRADKKQTKSSIFEELSNLTNANNQKISEVFSSVKTPSRAKKSYADTFPDNITFSTIKSRLSNDEYTSISDLIADFKTMVDNLRDYIQEGEESKETLDNVDILESALSKIEEDNRQTKSKRGRGRGKRKKVAKETDSTQASESESDSGSSANNKTVQAIFFGLIATLKNDETNRYVGPTFVNLPDKSIYPTYYEVITEPIDLRMIAKKIHSNEYKKNSDLMADFTLMAKNAKTFNEAKSNIYQDAVCIQHMLKMKLQEAEEIPKRKFRGRKRMIDTESSQEILLKFVNAKADEDPLKSVIDVEHPGKRIKPEQDSDEEEPDSSDDPDFEEDEPNTPSTRRGGPSRGRRGRGRGARSSTAGSIRSRAKLSDDEASLDSSQVASPLSSLTSSRVGPHGSFRWCLEEILLKMESEKDPEDNQLSAAFIRLPSKKVYPDYYEDIKNPICIYTIRQKLKKSGYDTITAFMSDIELLANNAMEYNVEGSKIYQDAIQLLKVAKDKCKELADKFPEVLSLPPALLASQPLAKKTPVKKPTSPSQNMSMELMNDDSQSSKPENTTPTKKINCGRRPLTLEESRRRRNNNLFNAVWNSQDEEGRLMREMFVTIPKREDYPDYFDVIVNPIDLTMIRDKIDREIYKDYVECREDFLLLFRNAKQYNEEGSQIHEDATKLETLVKKKVRSFLAEDQKARARHEQTEKNRREFAMQQNLGPPQLQQPPHPQQQQRLFYDGHPNNPQFMQGPPMMMPQHMMNQQPPIVHHPQPIPANMSLAQRMMIEIFYIIKEYKDSTGYSPSTGFLRKPNKKENPQYYKVIRRPIDLCSIAKGILSSTYPDFESFMSDVHLVFDNACRFYEANSKPYNDAMLLHRISLGKQASLLVALEANLPPGIAPLHNNIDINIGLRRLLTSLHNTMLTACDSEGRGLVDSLIAGDGTKDSKTSPTAVRLAGLHKAVAAGSYRRLDRLQQDWMIVLRLARIGDKEISIGEQQRNDAIELTRRWIRLRDEICSKRPQSKHPMPQVTEEQKEVYAVPQALTALIVTSASSSYTLEDLNRELAEEKEKYPLPELDDLTEGKPDLGDGDAKTLEQVVINEKTYKEGSYVTFKSSVEGEKDLIGRILAIDEKEQVHLARYMRSEEAQPSQRRRLFHGEVFRTPTVQVVKAEDITDSCVVIHIAKYIKNSVKGVEDSVVNICESHFSPKGGKFIKITRPEDIFMPDYVELVPRATSLIPNRLSPIEPLETALEQVDKTKYEAMVFPSPFKPKTVISTLEPEDNGEDETPKPDPNFEYYDQYVHENGFHVKLGDYLYVNLQKKANDQSPTMPDASPKKIMRVERLWKEKTDSTLYFSGPSFISPLAVEHLPTRMFYTKETFISSAPHSTVPLGQTTGKCHVMRPSDYAITRPTEFNEADVFVCESKYFDDEKGIRKLKKGLKRFYLPPDCIDEEFFSIPYVPLRKEPTPRLNLISKEPISDDQMNRNPAMAYSVVLQVSAMSQEGQTPNKTISEIEPNNLARSPNPTSMHQMVPNVSAPIMGANGPFHSMLPQQPHSVDMNGKSKSGEIKPRKPPSGYVIFASEQRKVMMQNRPDAAFGDISREVGQKWRQMPANERDIYERKAAQIKKTMEEEDKRAQIQQAMSSPPMSQQQQQIHHHLQQQQQQMNPQQMAFPNNNQRPPFHMQPQQQPLQQQQPNQHSMNMGQMPMQHFYPDPSQASQGHGPQPPPGQMIQIVANHPQQMMPNPVMSHATSQGPQQQHTQAQSQQQAIMYQAQPPKPQNSSQLQGQPLFVSVPPKACRVLHSEVYQKYIERLRKTNVHGLSDWRTQMGGSLEQHVARNNYQASRSNNQRGTIIEMAQKENAIASNFLNGVHKGSLSTDKVAALGNKTQIEALWELRDYMVNDVMRIQQRCLTLEEL